MFHLDRPLHLLGYIAAQQRVYLIDREYSVVSYTLLLALIEFKTLVMRGEMEEAFVMLDTLPEDQLDGCVLVSTMQMAARVLFVFGSRFQYSTIGIGCTTRPEAGAPWACS